MSSTHGRKPCNGGLLCGLSAFSCTVCLPRFNLVGALESAGQRHGSGLEIVYNEILTGLAWTPREGPFNLIRLGPDVPVIHIRRQAEKVCHCGRLGIAFWRPRCGTLLWVKAMEDCSPRFSSDDEIRWLFQKVREVREVLIHTEYIPNKPYEFGWERVFPHIASELAPY